jgi:uroporphyrinogen decarboxylase
MTSRERVLAAIDHKQPDIVPVDMSGTPSKIREQVLDRMEIFSRDGGYVFNTVHNILPDVPSENIIAMFDAVKEFNNR